ncbi:hypothetical protein BJV77DRAFT_953457, partial [Russula vinacea]
IVAEVSTCRRHCGSKHAGKYRNWCKKPGFESKLPGDVIARKLKPEQSQRTIDGYLVEKKSTDGSVAHSDRLFQQAVVGRLVATDQPIEALEHPKFKEMIDIASDPTNRVKIPDRKAVRNEIKALFSKYLTSLKSRLNVCTRLMELIRCLNFCRVLRCAARQTSHAMRGRPAIQKATLQLQAIGSKSRLLRVGSSRAHHSDSHRFTTPMMGSDSVRRYTKNC